MELTYHVNPLTGKVGKCRAKKNDCPFGSAHFASKEEAQVNAERVVKEEYEWVQVKENLTKRAKDWLKSHNLSGIPVQWRPELFDEETGTHSFAYLLDKKPRRKLFFSEEIRYLSEVSQKEIVPHELAHVKDRNPIGGAHGESWRDAFEEIVTKDMPNLGLTRESAQEYEVLTPEVAARLWEARSRRSGPKFRWECSLNPGHSNVVPYRKDVEDDDYDECPLQDCAGEKLWEEL